MRLSLPDIWLLYRHELRCALRESNIILYSFLVPALLYPFMVWMTMSAISFVTGQEQRSESRVVLVGLPPGHQALAARLVAEPRVKLVESSDPRQDLALGRVDAIVEFGLKSDPNLPDNAGVTVLYDASRATSNVARDRTMRRLKSYRDGYLEREGQRTGASVGEMQAFWVETRNHSSAQDVGRFLLGILLPFTLIVILSIGGMYPAIDSTAGERERLTWETSLTLATSRLNVVLAKYFYVSTMSALAGVLNLAAMVFSMRSIIAPLSTDFANSLSFNLPWSSVLVVLVGTILLALTMSAGMMILASFARTFREGQAMVTPVFLLTLIPVAFVADSTLEFDHQMALIPVVNVALLWREAIHGSYSPNLLLATMMVMLSCVVACVAIATWVLGYEDMVLGSYGGSFWQFVRERLGWRRK